MTSQFTTRRRPGFTLVELLIVVGILALLVGIVYASTGTVREKARQTVCVSHLRQLGQAMAIYRQDYGGSDEPGTGAQMGFPPTPFALIDGGRPHGGRYAAGHDDLLHCPSKILRPGEQSPQTRWCDYDYGFLQALGPVPAVARQVAERGPDFPVLEDTHHDAYLQRPDRPHLRTFVLILRLDGRVTRTWGEGETGWKW
jgi:prepilin-type N-terminal cleavage/methylation domain-containing protein